MLNGFKDNVLPAICAAVPCSFWSSLTRINPLIAYYHVVSDDDIPHVKHLYKFRTVMEFRRDIDCFCRQFHPISLHQLLENMKTGRSLPRNSILLTFDDGFSEIFHVIAPILREKGVPATFFLTTAFLDNKSMAHHNKISILVEQLDRMRGGSVEKEVAKVISQSGSNGMDVRTELLRVNYRHRDVVDLIARLLGVDFDAYLTSRQPYLTSEQVGQLIGTGFAIGGHSVDHPAYGLLPLEEQLRQTITSVRFLRDRFSLNYGAFAFPHGDRDITGRFFGRLFSTEDVHVTFGTQGLIKEPISRHFQRFSMENYPTPAERIIARNYTRGIYRKLTGRAVVGRSLE